MQRRAAAVSVALFLLVAGGSYAVIGAAERPTVSLENPDFAVEADEARTIGGTEYTFTEVTDGSATATWVNQSARYTTTWAANDTVQYRGDNYTVWIPNASDPAEFELRENRTVDRPTVEQNGTVYVVIDDGQNKTLVPRDDYVGEQQRYRFREGDVIDFEGNDNETTVAAVTGSEVTIEWNALRTNEVSFGEGANSTLGGEAYVAHFATRGGATVLELSTDYADYSEDVDRQETFHERMNGLWGVVILSSLAAGLLVMLAYMPSRY